MEDFNVLYVDDDRDYLKMVRFLFENAGISACFAESGSVALAAFREKPFDMIITDLNMPNMDGLELARNIRKLNTKVPIIMITGSSVHQHKLMDKDTQISSVLAKPVNIKNLLSLVREEREKKNVRFSTAGGKIKARLLGYGYWLCPRCHSRYQGWSPFNICSKCNQNDYEFHLMA